MSSPDGEADRIVQVVENAGIDILVTIELTDGMDAALRRAGLAAALPQSVVSPTRTTAGGGIATVGTIVPLRPPDDGGDTPDVTITLPVGVVLLVTSTHPVPPIGSDRTQRWRDGLDRSPGVPMALDHVLVSPTIAVEGVRAYDVGGTDHRLLVSQRLRTLVRVGVTAPSEHCISRPARPRRTCVTPPGFTSLMSSYRRPTPSTHLSCAGESSGAYDPGGPDRDPDDPGPAQPSPLSGGPDVTRRRWCR